MAFRATCCGLILSLITRLPRFTGDERLIGVPPQQSGEQSNRPFLNVRPAAASESAGAVAGDETASVARLGIGVWPAASAPPGGVKESCCACSTSARSAVCNTAFNSINA
jgi:hypothetical protein